MAHKSETPDILKNLITLLENLYNLKVRRILHEYSSRYTPQQNGVVERKNRTLIETARTMLVESQLPVRFWTKVVASACYTLNRVLTVKRHGKHMFRTPT